MGGSCGHRRARATSTAEKVIEEFHSPRTSGCASGIREDRLDAGREVMRLDGLKDAEYIEGVLVVRSRGASPFMNLEHLRNEQRARAGDLRPERPRVYLGFERPDVVLAEIDECALEAIDLPRRVDPVPW